MLRARLHDIDPGGADAGMAQDIGQLGNILFRRVEHHGKEVAQVVRKHLPGVYPRRAT